MDSLLDKITDHKTKKYLKHLVKEKSDPSYTLSDKQKDRMLTYLNKSEELKSLSITL